MVNAIRTLSLGDWGALASMASLLVSIAVLATLRHIRQAYLFAARFPALVERLDTQTAQISSYLSG
jgi:hypothetical protein